MCVLCNAHGENPNEALVYDDGRIRAALALHQKAANQGALMVYPVEHFESLLDLPEPLAREVMGVAQGLTGRLISTLGCEGVTLLQNNGTAGGQDVFHFHLHVIPRWSGDGYFGAPSSTASIEERRALAGRILGRD